MQCMGVTQGVCLVGFLVACTPLRDLDEASRGSDGAGGSDSGESTGGFAGSLQGTSGRAVVASAGQAQSGADGGRVTTEAGAGSGGHAVVAASGGNGSSVAGSDGSAVEVGAPSASGGRVPVQGGASGSMDGAAGAGSGGVLAGGISGSLGMAAGGISAAGKGGAAGAATGGRRGITDLPIDLPNSPVTGTFTVSSEAEWEVNGDFVPTFEVHTPTASYWVVKSLGMIVSLVDKDANDPRQWIDFSTGFRPLRGLPSYGTIGGTEAMSTTLDADSQTPTHLRLLSTSKSWRLVWDFYPTHVTLTITAAPVPYGFVYRGVPAGLFDSMDRFTLGSTGQGQSAQLSSVVDLAGPAEWAYVSDSARGRSLFLIQHGDDALVDRYQVKDNDSAMFSFGDGMLSALPMRFSFGVVPSAEYQTVKTRASFVIDAIH
jgi:hypothetical protein